jgi:drug/metabolite transporter (DMT)-like permease
MATIIVGFIAFRVQNHRMTWPAASWRFVLLGALMGSYFAAMFIALTMTSPISTSAVFTLMPIMTAFFGYLILKQVVRPIVAVSLLIAGLGSIWVIFSGDINAILGFDIGRGELIFLAGCVGHAIYAPLVRKFNRGEPVVVMTFFVLAATAIWLIAFGASTIVTTDWFNLPAFVWWSIFYLALLPTATTFFLLQYATMRLPASKVLSYGYLTPGFVILIEGFAGHGWVSLTVVAGALVTCFGLFMLYLTPDR